MKNVVSVLKEADMSKVIGLCMLKKSARRQKVYFDNWFSLYCYVVEACFPDVDIKMVVTRYGMGRVNDGSQQYDFYCVIGPDIDRRTEMPVLWESVLTGEVNLLIPECILNKLDNTYLAFTILECMERTYRDKLPKRKNTKLYERAKSYATSIKNKNRVVALHKGIEKIIANDIKYDELQNEILELYELKHLVLNWDRVLKFRGNYEDEVKNFFKENPVSYQRVKERQKKLLEKYTDLDIDDYFRNGVRNNRIIIESRIRKSDLPLIYVMNEAGTKKLISEVEEEDLLCMDIRVLDENVNEIKQVIAILMMYLEYPIRTKRLLCIQEQRRLVSVFRQLTS